ncbi:hypothetical protein HPB49_014910 [Dermacentor silvarum]|uniref:Uncharacterized protein n=1 Tax=Dermacentor silvarum TaxID=543639 RepID=A0ACB8DDS3_DERSI|nr:hypothetical protein HPB49_014910 [Dermacentor silvarum]
MKKVKSSLKVEAATTKLMAGPLEDVVGNEKDALLPLWTVLGIVTGALLISLLVKLYTVLTVGKCSSDVDMAGKTVIITGANTGIGKETARELARRNARVILACRNPVKAKEAAADIHASTGRSVVLMQLDLCSLNSVRQFARHVLATEPRLDVLILNAGMMSGQSSVVTLESIYATMQQMLYQMGELNNKVKENTLSSEDLERRIRKVEFGSRKRVNDENNSTPIKAYRRINNTGDVSDADNCDGGGMNVSNG